MLKNKSRKVSNRRKRPKLTEEQIRLLMMELEEIEQANLEGDDVTRRIRELMKGIPLDLRRRWAEEWREEHRRSR